MNEETYKAFEQVLIENIARESNLPVELLKKPIPTPCWETSYKESLYIKSMLGVRAAILDLAKATKRWIESDEFQAQLKRINNE